MTETTSNQTKPLEIPKSADSETGVVLPYCINVKYVQIYQDELQLNEDEKYSDSSLKELSPSPLKRIHRKLPNITYRGGASFRYSTLNQCVSPNSEVEENTGINQLIICHQNTIRERSKLVLNEQPSKILSKISKRKRIHNRRNTLNATELQKDAISVPGDYYKFGINAAAKKLTKEDVLERIRVEFENAHENFEEYEVFKAKCKTIKEQVNLAKKDNIMVRYHIKTLSDLITQLLPFKNDELYKNHQEMRAESTNKDKIEEGISKNYIKRQNYYEIEYWNQLKRLNQVKDPQYRIALKKQCLDLDKEINMMRKRIENYKNKDRIYEYVFY